MKRQPSPEAVAKLDTWVTAGGQLRIFPTENGWRVEVHWPSGNIVGCSMPTYAEAIELFVGSPVPPKHRPVS